MSLTEELQERIARLLTFYEHDRQICTESEWNEAFYGLLLRIKGQPERREDVTRVARTLSAIKKEPSSHSLKP